ncbi:MAG: hypothetical protein J2P15_01740 [Micromonosporaceae bacterium]|nr:hypothetical protein [Micromonosporaceae bacterium]
MARAGQALIGDTPPNGKRYWAARFWDRDSAEQHPVLAGDFLSQKNTIARYLDALIPGGSHLPSDLRRAYIRFTERLPRHLTATVHTGAIMTSQHALESTITTYVAPVP